MLEGNAIPSRQFKGAHYMWGQNEILALWPKSTYLWEVKMLNPYVKHGAFLVEFDDCIKTIQGDWFLSIKKIIIIIIIIKWLRKNIIPLMLKDDLIFKKVVSWFENTT
jgi:hypothetical protein